jgi:hypothetical protein
VSSYLKQVIYQLPSTNPNFTKLFISYLQPLSKESDNKLVLNKSQDDLLPDTFFEFSNIMVPTVIFKVGNEEYKVEIKNSTGKSKLSPHTYTPIEISDFIFRMKAIKLIGIDHTGFNLPFFDGIHPEILKLRDFLKDKCLYHEFPKNLADAPWDFIIPGTIEEIDKTIKTNYKLIRKPKIEIVSFDKSSTPLIQIDLQFNESYQNLLKLFPEAIDDSPSKSVWVYIKNDFGIDICFVLNKSNGRDWSHYFKGYRIV